MVGFLEWVLLSLNHLMKLKDDDEKKIVYLPYTWLHQCTKGSN
jgi:hypothetical protein